MTRLRNMNSEYEKQLVTFQRYLRFNQISTPLTVRMRSSAWLDLIVTCSFRYTKYI